MKASWIVSFALGAGLMYLLLQPRCGDDPVVVPADSSRVDREDSLPPPPLSKRPAEIREVIRWLRGDTVLLADTAQIWELKAQLDELLNTELSWEDSVAIYDAVVSYREYEDSVGDENATAYIKFRTIGVLAGIDEFYIQHHRPAKTQKKRRLEVTAGLNAGLGKKFEFDGVGAWATVRRDRGVLLFDASSINEEPVYLIGYGRTF